MEESPAPASPNSGPLSMPGDFNDLFLPGKSIIEHETRGLGFHG